MRKSGRRFPTPPSKRGVSAAASRTPHPAPALWPAMDFAALEAREGVRLSWNAWPSSRIEATRVVLPFGAVCTPVAPMPQIGPS